MKTKLMGGWKKQKNSGSISAYAYLSAFKFPDIMDLFLECTVSLCKSTCEECPEYLEASLVLIKCLIFITLCINRFGKSLIK